SSTATTAIYTLSLHDALPICRIRGRTRERDWRKVKHRKPSRTQRAMASTSLPLATAAAVATLFASPAGAVPNDPTTPATPAPVQDRKSTRLNSSHVKISYAVF